MSSQPPSVTCRGGGERGEEAGVPQRSSPLLPRIPPTHVAALVVPAERRVGGPRVCPQPARAAAADAEQVVVPHLRRGGGGGRDGGEGRHRQGSSSSPRTTESFLRPRPERLRKKVSGVGKRPGFTQPRMAGSDTPPAAPAPARRGAAAAAPCGPQAARLSPPAASKRAPVAARNGDASARLTHSGRPAARAPPPHAPVADHSGLKFGNCGGGSSGAHI